MLTRMLSVDAADRHSYFVYFVPEREPYQRLSSRWITEWVHAHFGDLAQALGSTGVIVSPPVGSHWHDQGIGEWAQFFSSHSHADEFLHGRMPFLIVSRKPIGAAGPDRRESLAINLVKCRDERELAEIFDIVSAAIRSGEWATIIEGFPAQDPANEPESYGGWLETLNGIITIKPNLFGIGLNFNEALEAAMRRIRSKHH